MTSTLTPAQVAEQLQCKPDMVYALIRSGELQAFTIGTPKARKPRWRIEAEAFEDFINRRQHRPPARPRRRKKSANVIQFF